MYITFSLTYNVCLNNQESKRFLYGRQCDIKASSATAEAKNIFSVSQECFSFVL